MHYHKKTVFCSLAEKISKKMPYLKTDLLVADINKSPHVFVESCIKQSILAGILGGAVSVLVGILLEEIFLYLSPVAFIVILVGVFFIGLKAPKTKIKKIVSDIEGNLPYVVKSIRIHLTAGATLFEVLVNVSKENHGELSKVFNKAVKQINMGKSVVEVLEETTERLPSLFFKNAMWPFIGGLKSGGDIIKIMDEISKSLSKQQINQAIKFGGKIQSISMISVVLGIVAPSMALIGVVIGSVFLGFSEVMVNFVFYFIVLYVVLVDALLVVLISANKPSLVKL